MTPYIWNIENLSRTPTTGSVAAALILAEREMHRIKPLKSAILVQDSSREDYWSLERNRLGSSVIRQMGL